MLSSVGFTRALHILSARTCLLKYSLLSRSFPPASMRTLTTQVVSDQPEDTTFHQLFIRKDNIHNTMIAKQSVLPSTDLKPGQILCKVDQVAITSNNVTYAVTGKPDKFNYWQFFPTGQDEWGMVPTWGYADVTVSCNPDIPVGDRVYGLYPLAEYCLLNADKVTATGFRDSAEHRQALNAVYNQYVRSHTPTAASTTSPIRHTSTEHLNSILRPMFTTSFLLDDFLWQCSSAPMYSSSHNESHVKTSNQNRANNSTNVGHIDEYIISSASSKTGYGTAFLLNRRRAERKGTYKIVGLTSECNVEFVKDLGLYDTVLTYDEIDKLPSREGKVIYADFSGNCKLRSDIHHFYGDNLMKDVVIGITDYMHQGSAKGLPGVRAEPFFAPSQVLQRQKEWGKEVLFAKIESNLGSFVDYCNGRVDITEVNGAQNIQKLWHDLVEWKVTPEQGFIAKF
eukprot:CFRG4386T1